MPTGILLVLDLRVAVLERPSSYPFRYADVIPPPLNF